ncbi:hypothetical protein BKA57DRAFT_455914 [Linnemannia elongata]|nr:hypothetical protein BKA57DRAFT_480107 [Linnemannia elongata]KAH7052549.1 hypothetical protein BKA57DRAFT_455914 [Linnemannia elongata]
MNTLAKASILWLALPTTSNKLHITVGSQPLGPHQESRWCPWSLTLLVRIRSIHPPVLHLLIRVPPAVLSLINRSVALAHTRHVARSNRQERMAWPYGLVSRVDAQLSCRCRCYISLCRMVVDGVLVLDQLGETLRPLLKDRRTPVGQLS